MLQLVESFGASPRVNTLDRAHGGSAAEGRGGGPSSRPSDELELPDELPQLRASDAALRMQTRGLTDDCADLQLRINGLEEARLCTICLD